MSVNISIRTIGNGWVVMVNGHAPGAMSMSVEEYKTNLDEAICWMRKQVTEFYKQADEARR